MEPRPLTYRAEIIAPMLKSIAAGECCNVVGINGVGKSNLVQHMLRPDVLSFYLDDTAASHHFVTLDANLLARWDGWSFFEGLAEALARSQGQPLAAETVERLRQLHSQILAAPGDAARALRLCGEACDLLCSQRRIVLLCDEFDPLFMELPAHVLRNLRGLRDRHKYRLVYLAFTRQPLSTLRSAADWDAIEPFVELFTLHEFGLQPLTDPDALGEVARFAGRHGEAVPEPVRTAIVGWSGGHPALLRAFTRQALEPGHLHLDDLARGLLPPPVADECAKIWGQLTDDEQDALTMVLRGQPLEHEQQRQIVLKGLARAERDGTPRIFSPALALYVAAISAPDPRHPGAALVVDPQQRRVEYYGRDISALLSALEYRLIVFLWERLGQVCPVEHVAEAVYPGEDNSDLQRLRTLARRLRRRLESLAPDRPPLLRIYPARGYRLGLPPA